MLRTMAFMIALLAPSERVAVMLYSWDPVGATPSSRIRSMVPVQLDEVLNSTVVVFAGEKLDSKDAALSYLQDLGVIYEIDRLIGSVVLVTPIGETYGEADAAAFAALQSAFLAQKATGMDEEGLMVNYPEGEGIVTKWDDLTYAEDDIVKVVARQYAGYGITAPGRLVRLCKPAGAETT